MTETTREDGAAGPTPHTPTAHTPTAHTPTAHTPTARTSTPHTPTPHTPTAHTPTARTSTPHTPTPRSAWVLDRRTVLAAGVSAVGVGVLAACSGGGGSAGPRATPGGPLVALADVPVGGAVAVTTADGEKVVVAQPEAGQVVAFSAVCTHQGCTVAPDGDRLRCPCHGSVFEAFTGAVVNGPATEPLPGHAVRVEGDGVVEA